MPFTTSEHVIRRLYQITNDYNQGFNAQIKQLLKMGLERFNLDIAILSRIEGDVYTVEHCYVPEGVELKPGDTFEFGVSYCCITCEAQAPVVFEHISQDEKYGNHPAYLTFGLESYIGVPIRLNGQLYGTLNFTSPTPYPRLFQDIDVDALQLMASWIEVELVRRQQEAQLKALNLELKLQAEFDSLTGVSNRRGMYKNLHKALNHLNRQGGKATFAIVDVDYFKLVNDQYGHQVGDEVLVQICSKIQQSLRDYDFIARLGGEEFVIWLSDSDEASCNVVFKRIKQHLTHITVVKQTLSVSIGACHLNLPSNHMHDKQAVIDLLLQQADKALYQAKDQGRNCAVNVQFGLD